MAKDGTLRGGQRVESGRKAKPLSEKINQGTRVTVLEFPKPTELKGEYIPPVKDFLKAAQKSGVDLCAENVFKTTYLWLQERGCERFVNTQLIAEVFS